MSLLTISHNPQFSSKSNNLANQIKVFSKSKRDRLDSQSLLWYNTISQSNLLKRGLPMYQLVPTYPFSKKISKTAQPVTGYQLEFLPFEEEGVTKQIVVLDIDTPNAHIIANYIMAYLGLSRTVKSVNGMHIYYKMPINDVKRLKSVYYLKLVNLLEQGIIDEVYAKQFIKTNKHAYNVSKKHNKMLFPIEVKTKRIMAPGSIVFTKAEKLYKNLAKEGKIDSEQFNPEDFLKSNFGVSSEFYRYKADSDKPIHEDLADLTVSRLLAFFHDVSQTISSYSEKEGKELTEKYNKVSYQIKNKKSSLPFVYSCPKFGNESKQETLRTSDYLARLIKDVIGKEFEIGTVDFKRLAKHSVERKMGKLSLGKAILCPIHRERNASVAFYETKNGIRMFEFHRNRTNNNCKSLEELLFFLNHNREVRMINGDGNYTYILRYLFADNGINSCEQIRKSNALNELVVKLYSVADLSNASKHKLNKLEKISKLLLALASNFATTFSDDIFSARFGEKIVGYSKSSVNLFLRLFLEVGALAIVGKKNVNSKGKALIYTVPFDSGKAFTIAVRILVILGLLELKTSNTFSRKTIWQPEFQFQKAEQQTIDRKSFATGSPPLGGE